jgi:serine/threonine protein kinase
VPSAGLAHDPEFRARFRQEVDAARRVGGNRVARVLDADAETDRPWLATEYVEGASLTDALHAHGRFDGPMLTSLATGLAEALVAIHSAGVVHRDLKPSNVLLSWEGPKVIDFGIARAMDATRHTRTGMMVGTMVWMAPEQLRGERAGTAADVFAWGACIAFAGTGRPPFRGERPEAVALQIVQGEPELGGLPADIAGLVRETLAKDPAARPTAAELVARLASTTGDTAVTARLAGVLPPGADTGLERFGSRTGVTRPARPGPGPYDAAGAPPTGPGRGGGSGGGRPSRVPLALAAAALLLVVGTAIAAATLANRGDNPSGDVGPQPSASTTTEGPAEHTTPQPPPEDTPRESSPSAEPSPSPDGNPTTATPPTTPPTSGPPTTQPTAEPPTTQPAETTEPPTPQTGSAAPGGSPRAETRSVPEPSG